jgi:hypothetical protein
MDGGEDMKTIMVNKTELNISTTEERALSILVDHDFTVPLSAFEEGRSWRYKTFILPRGSRGKKLGVEVIDLDILCNLFGGISHQRNLRKEVMERGTAAVIRFWAAGAGTWAGVPVCSQQAASRIKRFFCGHPRHRKCVLGDPRKINLILKKLSE